MPNSLTGTICPKMFPCGSDYRFPLSGDEVMPLNYHAGRSGWLLYGRGLDKRWLTAWQRELGAALVIVASQVVEELSGYSSGGLSDAAGNPAGARSRAGCRPLGNSASAYARAAGDGYGLMAIQIRVHWTEIAKLAGTGEMVSK